MAFGVQAIYSGGTVSLTDKSPYGLRSARGLSGAPVRRVTSRGPYQDGDSDLGYRLQPREVELEIGFYATTDAILDGYRDTLMAVFKPLSATPVYLRVTRDDGEVRQLDCHTVGSIDIKIIPEHRPGHYHVATIRLRAPDPAYYDITPGTVTATASSGTAADWYLAGGAIGTASVLMSGGTPTQGQAWSYTGTIANTTSYTLAFRSPLEALGAAEKYAFHVANGGFPNLDIAFVAGTIAAFGYQDMGGTIDIGAPSILGTAFMRSGTANYFLRHDPNGVTENGVLTGYKHVYYNGISYANPNYESNVEQPISGTNRRWRSNSANAASSRWTSAILLYALYSPGLSEAQIAALGPYMDGAVGGTAYLSPSIQYEGDLPEYPIISVRGPITGLVINNVATGDSIALGTNTIANGETYVFDLRPGYKTVTSGTVNKRDKLASYSDWDEWHLAPDPIGVQGSNPIYVYGTNTSGSTQISIVYYERYSSY